MLQKKVCFCRIYSCDFVRLSQSSGLSIHHTSLLQYDLKVFHETLATYCFNINVMCRTHLLIQGHTWRSNSVLSISQRWLIGFSWNLVTYSPHSGNVQKHVLTKPGHGLLKVNMAWRVFMNHGSVCLGSRLKWAVISTSFTVYAMCIIVWWSPDGEHHQCHLFHIRNDKKKILIFYLNFI